MLEAATTLFPTLLFALLIGAQNGAAQYHPLTHSPKPFAHHRMTKIETAQGSNWVLTPVSLPCNLGNLTVNTDKNLNQSLINLGAFLCKYLPAEDGVVLRQETVLNFNYSDDQTHSTGTGRTNGNDPPTGFVRVGAYPANPNDMNDPVYTQGMIHELSFGVYYPLTPQPRDAGLDEFMAKAGAYITLPACRPRKFLKQYSEHHPALWRSIC